MLYNAILLITANFIMMSVNLITAHNFKKDYLSEHLVEIESYRRELNRLDYLLERCNR